MKDREKVREINIKEKRHEMINTIGRRGVVEIYIGSKSNGEKKEYKVGRNTKSEW